MLVCSFNISQYFHINHPTECCTWQQVSSAPLERISFHLALDLARLTVKVLDQQFCSVLLATSCQNRIIIAIYHFIVVYVT